MRSLLPDATGSRRPGSDRRKNPRASRICRSRGPALDRSSLPRNTDSLSEVEATGDVMAYLAPHFQFDAFVSYSWGDPGRIGDSPLKRWTNTLVSELQSEILAVDTEFDQ